MTSAGPLPCWLGFLEQKRKETVTEWGCTDRGDESGEKEIPADGGERKCQSLKTDGNSKRKALVNKRKDPQKEHAGYKRKKHGGVEKLEESYSTGHKKIVMRENRKRKKPFETDSKFKMQEEKTKRKTRAGQTT